jgi:hypothetical protein
MKTQLAMTALLAAVATAPACGDLKKETYFSVDRLAYGPDGTLVVFTNGGLFLFADPSLETEKGRIPLDGLPTLDGYARYDYSLSRDGTVAAVSYSAYPAMQPVEATKVALYRVPGGERLTTFRVDDGLQGNHSHALAGLALSPRGDLVAVLPFDSGPSGASLTVVDAATGVIIWRAAGDKRLLPAWAPDGATLYVMEFGPPVPYQLQAFDALAGSLKWSRDDLSLVPDALAITADGTMLAGVGAAWPDGPCQNVGDCPSVYPFWSTADGSQVTQVPGVPGTVSFVGGSYSGLRCSATDDACAAPLAEVNAQNPEEPFIVRIYRPDGTVVATVHTLGPPLDVALSPDGLYVAAIDYLQVPEVRVYRIADGTLVGSRLFAADLL